MNKKDLEFFRKEKERQEETLIMNAIHKNAKENHDKFIMKNNIKKIKNERKERNSKRLAYALCAIFAISLVALAFKYTDSQVSSCVKAGNSTSFCENNLR